MSFRRAVLVALVSVALTIPAGVFDGVAPGLSVSVSAAAPPCAPIVGERPSTPKNLRIIPGIADLQSSADAFVSGPYAPDEDYRMADYRAAALSGAHAYFDMLSARSECAVAYSLRDMNQLLHYMDTTKRTLDITYDPANDPDPRRQDAAKILIPANVVSLPNNVRLPIPAVGSDSLLVVWDSWLGREYGFATTGIANYKHFQFASPERIWTEVQSDFKAAPASATAIVEVRQYAEAWGGVTGPNVTNDSPLSPMANQFAIMPETWTRYWAYFNKVGDWHEFSLWVADERRDPVLVIDRRQINPNYALGATGWQKFWLEYNTSGKGLADGFPARVAYARNVVMMKGVTNVAALLQRPTN